MEITGRVKMIGQIQEVSPKFKKREIVVKTLEDFPQYISINFVQDKCDLLNGYSVGQQVTVGINIKGREWVNPQGETKYFNTIIGWRIERLNSVQVNQTATKSTPHVNQVSETVDSNEDDLPF